MTHRVLELIAIQQIFYQAGTSIEVLSEINLTVDSGEIVGLLGPSGAGKSSLLYIAGLLEKATEGEVHILGLESDKLNDESRTKIRSENIGFVYQNHHLLSEFSASENVMLPQLILGKSKKLAECRSKELLRSVGLEERLAHRPARLSGGEQQRVAVARALANQPQLLLADEPTGNLDPATGEIVFNLILELVRNSGIAALIATHNHTLVSKMDRIVRLNDGKLIVD